MEDVKKDIATLPPTCCGGCGGLFPQLSKPKSKCVEILSQSGLHNPSVTQNP